MRAEELKGHLDALLLAALEGGPRHGYAVIEELRQSTGGTPALPTATVYPAPPPRRGARPLPPARRTGARRPLTGPGTGLCWGLALIPATAWPWPVPASARAAFGAALLISIGLLAAAAYGRRYRSARRAATAGCAGIALLDISMLFLAAARTPALKWPVALAMAASLLRIAYAATALGRAAAS